ncbi:hypothetical protein H0H92_010109 [Tricholoma furcatifolium]|nr:hypothetical protein H0H92_010109 [Tricholoma furcatifolium]
MVYAQHSAYPELSVSVYGGGQMQSTYRGHVVVEHGGSVTGFNTLVTRLPFDNIGVAVLTNDNDYGTFWCESIRYRLLDEALNLTYVDWDSRIKQLAYELLPLPATPRPANATLPSASFASLAGVYENAGYGQAEFCYVSSPDPKQSEACKALASNASTILPGAVQEGIPTFIAAWDSPWATHIMLNHFDGNFFNVTPLISAHDPNNSSEPYWTYGVSALDSGASAEFQVDGDQIAFGFFGIWGAGGGIPDPQGNTLQERAEVWLEKA